MGNKNTGDKNMIIDSELFKNFKSKNKFMILFITKYYYDIYLFQ
jgi:hypothetical protein